MKLSNREPQLWIKAILVIGAIYSLVWGLLIVFFPNMLFVASHLDAPNYTFLWQTTGAIEIIFSIGLMIASRHAYKNWTIILLIALAKFLAVIIYFNSAFAHEELFSLSNYIFVDNIVWIIPFLFILYRSYEYHTVGEDYEMQYYSRDAITLDMFETSEGLNVDEMTHKWPTLVVFLRHFGCTFCREAMNDIAIQRNEIEKNGTRILIVHMLEDEEEAHLQLEKFGLGDIPSLSDPEKLLYKKFQLRQGSIFQLFGLKVWARGLYKGLLKGLGIGAPQGDPLQMPGVFLMFKGKTVRSYIHKSAADRPEYIKLAECGSCY